MYSEYNHNPSLVTLSQRRRKFPNPIPVFTPLLYLATGHEGSKNQPAPLLSQHPNTQPPHFTDRQRLTLTMETSEVLKRDYYQLPVCATSRLFRLFADRYTYFTPKGVGWSVPGMLYINHRWEMYFLRWGCRSYSITRRLVAIKYHAFTSPCFRAVCLPCTLERYF